MIWYDMIWYYIIWYYIIWYYIIYILLSSPWFYPLFTHALWLSDRSWLRHPLRLPRIPPLSAWKIRRSPASRTTSFPQGMGAMWCNGDMIGDMIGDISKIHMEYHGISWNIMEYHGISWNITEYHGIFMEYIGEYYVIYIYIYIYTYIYIYIYIYMLVNTRQSWLPGTSDGVIFSQQNLRFGSGISQPAMFDDTEAWGKQHCIPSGNLLHSHWKWPFIVDFPMKNGDFPSFL